MKLTKPQLRKIIKEEIRETFGEGSEDWSDRLGLKVTPKQAEVPPQQDSAKQILKNVAAELAQIEDLDAISEDEAMDILDVVIDGMQQMLHLGGFGTPSPVKEGINEIVMTQEPMDIIDELKGLTNKLSRYTAGTQPFQDITLDMISQIKDLEEILITEDE